MYDAELGGVAVGHEPDSSAAHVHRPGLAGDLREDSAPRLDIVFQVLAYIFLNAGVDDDVLAIVGVCVDDVRLCVIFDVGGEHAHVLVADADVALGYGDARVFVEADFVGVEEYFVRDFGRLLGGVAGCRLCSFSSLHLRRYSRRFVCRGRLRLAVGHGLDARVPRHKYAVVLLRRKRLRRCGESRGNRYKQKAYGQAQRCAGMRAADF